MHGSQDAVEAFHLRFGFPVKRRILQDNDLDRSTHLRELGEQLQEDANNLLDDAITSAREENDNRFYRAHLIMEEVGEVLDAMGERDEVNLADALGDLIYVVLGTAVTYDIPLEEVFDEIHRSNMTKTRNAKDDPRMKKGKLKASYSPPDIRKAIDKGRKDATIPND